MTDETGRPAYHLRRVAAGDYFHLRYSDQTEFVVDRHGARIWASWPESLPLEDTATYLLRPVFGFVLGLRGVSCLHASVVVVGGRAVALLGPAEAGKSTTAAVFALQGYPVLSDDVAALLDWQGRVLVQPAYPQLRLWPSSVAALYGSPDALPTLTPMWEKCRLDFTGAGYHFEEQPVPWPRFTSWASAAMGQRPRASKRAPAWRPSSTCSATPTPRTCCPRPPAPASLGSWGVWPGRSPCGG
jgi:hypothetical protein